MEQGGASDHSVIDDEMVEIFQLLGFRKNVSKVLVLMFHGFVLTSREIERGTDLRQPEVSLAITYLTKQRWIKVVDHSNENKGRPVKLYQLADSTDEILDVIKGQVMGDYSKKIACIEKVRDLVHEVWEKEAKK